MKCQTLFSSVSFSYFLQGKHRLTFHANCMPKQIIHMKSLAFFSEKIMKIKNKMSSAATLLGTFSINSVIVIITKK